MIQLQSPKLGEKGIRKNIERFSNFTVNSVFYPIFHYRESGWLEGESSFQNLFEYIKLLYCKLSYRFT